MRLMYIIPEGKTEQLQFYPSPGVGPVELARKINIVETLTSYGDGKRLPSSQFFVQALPRTPRSSLLGAIIPPGKDEAMDNT